MNGPIIPVLTKLSINNPAEWWKHVGRVQQIINASHNRSIKKTPFKLLIGEQIRLKGDQELKQLIDEKLVNIFDEDRTKMRLEAKENIAKIQEENKRTYNKRRKTATKYKIGDLVAIKRTQFGTGTKLLPKFLGPYKATSLKGKDRYEVIKVGEREGPQKTSSAADHMKPWVKPLEFDEDTEEDDDFEDNEG